MDDTGARADRIGIVEGSPTNQWWKKHLRVVVSAHRDQFCRMMARIEPIDVHILQCLRGGR